MLSTAITARYILKSIQNKLSGSVNHITLIVYNITTKVHSAIDAAWRQWQREEHIPEIMGTGLFSSYRFFRLLEQDDSEGSTYAVQYTAPSEENYQEYTRQFAPLLRKKALEKWGDRIISFRSLLEVIH